MKPLIIDTKESKFTIEDITKQIKDNSHYDLIVIDSISDILTLMPDPNPRWRTDLEFCLTELENEEQKLKNLKDCIKYKYVKIVDNPSHKQTILNLKKRIYISQKLK